MGGIQLPPTQNHLSVCPQLHQGKAAALLFLRGNVQASGEKTPSDTSEGASLLSFYSSTDKLTLCHPGSGRTILVQPHSTPRSMCADKCLRAPKHTDGLPSKVMSLKNGFLGKERGLKHLLFSTCTTDHSTTLFIKTCRMLCRGNISLSSFQGRDVSTRLTNKVGAGLPEEGKALGRPFISLPAPEWGYGKLGRDFEKRL